jgi:dihydroxyacid dehydratase/phosphogluconate dehydratase
MAAPSAKIRDGDMIRLDANEGTLTFIGDEKEFRSRTPGREDLRDEHYGMGSEFFAGFRAWSAPPTAVPACSAKPGARSALSPAGERAG